MLLMTALAFREVAYNWRSKSLAPFLNDLSVIFSSWHASIRI